jgi:hypothetical protein
MGLVVRVTPRPRFTPGERAPGTHCTGGWAGPRVGLDTEVTGKASCLCRRSNIDSPDVQSLARHYTDRAKPALHCQHRCSKCLHSALRQQCFKKFGFYYSCSSNGKVVVYMPRIMNTCVNLRKHRHCLKYSPSQ